MEEARAQLVSLRRAYAQAARAPGAESKPLGARFKEACTRVENGIAAHRETLQRLERELFVERARLCRELERRVLCDSGAEEPAEALAAAHAAWSALPAMRGAASEALEQRFRLACGAARSAAQRGQLEQSLAAQTEEKRRLCLRMEILAGVPSPARHDAERLRYRAQWMQESLRGLSRWPGSDAEKLDEARRIEARWHGLGASPPAEDEELEARYGRALSGLRGAGAAR
jgi:hypothetical protein